jgi:hypothetical protein
VHLQLFPESKYQHSSFLIQGFFDVEILFSVCEMWPECKVCNLSAPAELCTNLHSILAVKLPTTTTAEQLLTIMSLFRVELDLTIQSLQSP